MKKAVLTIGVQRRVVDNSEILPAKLPEGKEPGGEA